MSVHDVQAFKPAPRVYRHLLSQVARPAGDVLLVSSNPFDVAKQMVRVTRPGGRIVMGNWIPNDPTLVAQILRISAAYSPPPPDGFVSPMTWGVEANVVERFAGSGVAANKV